jgi:hypothetical protein
MLPGREGGDKRYIEVKVAEPLYINTILPRMLVNSCRTKVKMFVLYLQFFLLGHFEAKLL